MSNDARAPDWKSQLGTVRPGQISIEHLWLVLPIFVQIIFGFRKQLNVLDFWWHLKVGDLILETKSLMRVDYDPFTTTAQHILETVRGRGVPAQLIGM